MSILAKPARRALGTALAATLASGMLAAPPAAAVNSAEAKTYELTNDARLSRNRNALKLNAKLSRIAKKHSRRMAKRGELYHNPNLVTQIGGMKWRRVAENVGMGPEYDQLDDSIRTVHNAFMDSRPHRKNILRRGIGKVGVGVVRRGGSVWVTVVFLG